MLLTRRIVLDDANATFIRLGHFQELGEMTDLERVISLLKDVVQLKAQYSGTNSLWARHVIPASSL